MICDFLIFAPEPGYNRFKPSSSKGVNLAYFIDVNEIFKVSLHNIICLTLHSPKKCKIKVKAKAGFKANAAINCWWWMLGSGIKVLLFFLEVSDADFTLHASYIITYYWEDNRVFINDPAPPPYYILDTNLLDKFWSPKVTIRHTKKSVQSAGLLYHKTSFGLSGVTTGGNSTFDVSVSIKPEITCPMDFSWYPFDTQSCHFIMNSAEPSIRFFNTKPLKEGSKPKRQNTQLEYDITLQELEEEMTTNADKDVSIVDSLTKYSVHYGIFTYRIGRISLRKYGLI